MKDGKFNSMEYLESRGKGETVVVGEVLKIRLDTITPNPWQPRKTFRKVPLEELAASIKEKGVLQPITIRRSENPETEAMFEIVTGERRWRAAKMAGLTEIPAVIKDVPDNCMRTEALIENIQREEMPFLDTIRGCVDLRDEFGTLEEVAKRVSKDRTTVARYCKTHEAIYSLPDIAPLFEKQTLSVNRTTAENFAKVAGDIRRLQKSNKGEYERVVRRLGKEESGGIKGSIPWLLSKFKKGKNEDVKSTHGDGMFRETDREFVLHIKVKKDSGLSAEQRDGIKKEIDIFMGRLTAIPVPETTEKE